MRTFASLDVRLMLRVKRLTDEATGTLFVLLTREKGKRRQKARLFPLLHLSLGAVASLQFLATENMLRKRRQRTVMIERLTSCETFFVVAGKSITGPYRVF